MTVNCRSRLIFFDSRWLNCVDMRAEPSHGHEQNKTVTHPGFINIHGQILLYLQIKSKYCIDFYQNIRCDGDGASDSAERDILPQTITRGRLPTTCC